jgi:Xaa-Pro dipeptidase
MPRLPDVYRIWCGDIHSQEHFLNTYLVEEVKYSDEMVVWFQEQLSSGELADSASRVHVMKGVNSDSGAEAKPARFPDDDFLWNENNSRIETSVLYEIIAQARVHKSAEEVELMRYVAYVASCAHVEVMKIANKCSYEYELEAKFLYEIYAKGGCRRAAYTAICACGPNSAILHYGHAGAPNERGLKPTDLVSSY